jgi:hypothetical protein
MATRPETRNAAERSAEQDSLPSWSDGTAKRAIVDFVQSSHAVSVAERVAVFAGNSNGDVPMLQFTKHDDKPSLRLVVLHDDGEREFNYTSGAEQALEQAGNDGWTVVSIKNDWVTVF